MKLMRAVLALVLVLAAAPAARAQGSLGMSAEEADTLLNDAFAAPYGSALLKSFAVTVRQDGDAACLDAKALDDAALTARGRSLFLRYGMRMMKSLDEAFDRSACEAALAASVGPNAAAEVERLKRNPQVKMVLALERPIKLAKVADLVVEQYDRYLLIRRVKLGAVPTVAEMGIDKDNPSESMRAYPGEAAQAALFKFIAEHPSRQIARYYDLADAMQAARPKGVIPQLALKLGPMSYFAGVESDLAELCVGQP